MEINEVCVSVDSMSFLYNNMGLFNLYNKTLKPGPVASSLFPFSSYAIGRLITCCVFHYRNDYESCVETFIVLSMTLYTRMAK